MEKFIRNLRWRTEFYLKPEKRPSKETYGFKSVKAAPPNEALKQFEKRLLEMIRDVVFRPWSNDFQSKLRNDLNNILSSDDVLVAADKTNNYYGMKVDDYNELLNKEIQDGYRKVTEDETTADLNVHKELVRKLDIEDRVMHTPPQPAYVTLKDHKPNFNNNP